MYRICFSNFKRVENVQKFILCVPPKGLVQSDRGGSISLFLVISLGQKALT